METLFTFWDIDEARMARTLLEAHNIEVLIPDEMMVQAHWGMLYAIGGVRLQVPAKDADRAEEIFARERDPVHRDFEPPSCHACGCEIEPASLSRSWALAAIAFLHLPLPFAGGYVCVQCKLGQKGNEELAAADPDAVGLGTPYDPPQARSANDGDAEDLPDSDGPRDPHSPDNPPAENPDQGPAS